MTVGIPLFLTMINKQEQRKSDQTSVIGQSWPLSIINLSRTVHCWYMYSHQFTMPALLFHSVIHTRTSSPDQHQFLLTNQKGCYLQRCSPNKCWRGPGQTPREPYVLFDWGTIAPIKMFPALCTYFNDLQIIILLHMPLMARSILLFPINQFNMCTLSFKIALQQRWLSPSIFVIKNIVLQSFLPQQLTGRKQRNVKKK